MDIKAKTINGRCSNCGDCCTDFIPWTKEEVSVVKEYLKQHPEIKQQPYIIGNDFYIRCAFRDAKNNKCLIYPVRPGICKDFQCNQLMVLIQYNKIKRHEQAYYNRVDESGKYTNWVSSHYLFFGDMKFDAQFAYNTTNSERDMFKYLYEVDAVILKGGDNID